MDRHPDLATAEDSLLLVIDPQEKLVRMIHNREDVVNTISQLIKFAYIYQLPVVLTEHYPEGLGYSVEEIKEVLADYQPVRKRIFSCFGVPEFSEVLSSHARRNLLVTGIETHICVSQTVHDALHRDYRVQVIADAVGTRKPLDHNIALDRMGRAGAVITTSEAVMYEIAERADTEEFKRLLKLVK
jgi:nicotinamidase-related amidase